MTVRPGPQLRGFGASVAGWGTEGGESRRPDLPWRHTRDPWAVLVSETLAQQTQLSRVVPAYHRVLAAFPDPATCAAAPLGDVLRAWEGMGYNRRAKNLHGAARAIVADHHGAVPDDLDALLTLPGVGPYTARAVLAFAFGRDVGVVDTNAGRVIARGVAGRPVGATEAQATVDAMVPPGGGWAFGQALLDLGATVCTSRDPDCGSCPVRRRCRWWAAGRPGPDPARGSAGVSVPQARFAGSERQGRGRLVAALRSGPVAGHGLAAAAGWPDDPARASRVAERLVAEGLAVRDRLGTLRLP
ncbi:MAG: A/G-specific adenine glycosylase [Acidimicrobiales bacterium]